ncbi:SDR family NAD(P)-dependent oxidoreductase [Streptomyces sp. NPDC047525]|uniref:SDR family NAD(P)-dependent oxidoreductase n=1 Tax=Streptomyces sp. NPDC047525 TaxID=3155264 RepID=UPI0033F6C7AA
MGEAGIQVVAAQFDGLVAARFVLAGDAGFAQYAPVEGGGRFEQAGKGVFVNLSSYTAFEPMSMIPVNSAMCTALTGFTKLYADQYAAKGIRMNSLMPGYVNSWPEAPSSRRSLRAGFDGLDTRPLQFLVPDAMAVGGRSPR